MKDSNLNSFEEEWQSVFENASMSPPDDMWAKIESDLDKKERQPFLDFFRSPQMLAGIAAALILMLGVLFFLNKNLENNPTANVIDTKNNPINNATREVPLATSAMPNTNEMIAMNALTAKPNLEVTSNKYIRKTDSDLIHNQDSFKNKQQNGIEPVSTETLTQTLAINHVSDLSINPTQENRTVIDEVKKFSEDKVASMPLVAENADNIIAKKLEMLVSKKYKYFGSSYTLQRNKLAFNSEDFLQPKEKTNFASNNKSFWLGIQSGAAPFNANMKFDNMNTMALAQASDYVNSANNDPQTANDPGTAPVAKQDGNLLLSQPQNTLKSGLGINSGIALGYKFSKKFNVESGIRYLKGKTTLESNTYAFNQSGYINSFLADYLLSNNDINTNTIVADMSNSSNNYEYLMIPLQVGYDVNITNKLGISVLAGFSTDIFIQNTIISNSNALSLQKNIITNNNGIYKPINLSGLSGLRFTYIVGKHWQAILGSSYQQALFSSFKRVSSLQMKPQLLGINYGINYRF